VNGGTSKVPSLPFLSTGSAPAGSAMASLPFTTNGMFFTGTPAVRFGSKWK
jgi:hypothetical protein